MPITDKKIFILARNPIRGGIPAIENNVKAKVKAIPELDFFNRTKSLNSLLYLFFKCLFLNLIKIKVYQTHNPEII
jgi:hypothetical protein